MKKYIYLGVFILSGCSFITPGIDTQIHPLGNEKIDSQKMEQIKTLLHPNQNQVQVDSGSISKTDTLIENTTDGEIDELIDILFQDIE